MSTQTQVALRTNDLSKDECADGRHVSVTHKTARCGTLLMAASS